MKFEEARARRVAMLAGRRSRTMELRCPRKRTTWPHDCCVKAPCPWWVNAVVYKNCSFLAAQISDHTLSEIGAMLGISRERVRQIQDQAIGKLVKQLKARNIYDELMDKQSVVKRKRKDPPKDPEHIREDETDIFCYFCSGDVDISDW